MTDLRAAIDKRVTTWLEVRRKIERKEIKDTRLRKTITISREFGCDAYELAKKIKAQLDKSTKHPWTIFDEEAIDTVSSEKELSVRLPEASGESGEQLDTIVSDLQASWETEQARFKAVTKTIFNIALNGHAILVGRGAFAITKYLENCYHFRLIANQEFRIRSFAERNELSVKEARTIVIEQAEARDEYFRRFLNTEFTLDKFHLILNDDKIPTNIMADTIIRLMHQYE